MSHGCRVNVGKYWGGLRLKALTRENANVGFLASTDTKPSLYLIEKGRILQCMMRNLGILWCFRCQAHCWRLLFRQPAALEMRASRSLCHPRLTEEDAAFHAERTWIDFEHFADNWDAPQLTALDGSACLRCCVRNLRMSVASPLLLPSHAVFCLSLTILKWVFWRQPSFKAVSLKLKPEIPRHEFSLDADSPQLQTQQDYTAPTPDWALLGSPNEGFAPTETRKLRVRPRPILSEEKETWTNLASGLPINPLRVHYVLRIPSYLLFLWGSTLRELKVGDTHDIGLQM